PVTPNSTTGSFISLPKLSGGIKAYANDIDSWGKKVVGTAKNSSDQYKAVIWEACGDSYNIYNLNDCISNPISGLDLQYGKAINDKGWIIATGYISGSGYQEYILIPN